MIEYFPAHWPGTGRRNSETREKGDANQGTEIDDDARRGMES